jgi:hypothetical protein
MFKCYFCLLQIVEIVVAYVLLSEEEGKFCKAIDTFVVFIYLNL